MIAIGGAIGVGLFLGSAFTIEMAGPGVVISYILAAFIAAIMAYALAEMAIVYPAAGSFGVYADKYVSPWAGFTVRLTYWFAQTVAIGAEVTAVGLYFGYWFPAVPSWAWIVASSALVLVDQARTFLRITSRTPRSGLRKDFDLPRSRDPDQAKPQQPTQLPHPRIPHVAACRGTDGEPDLIAGGTAIDALQDKLEIERELQLADDDYGKRFSPQRHHIAATDLTLYREAETLQVALDRAIERGFCNS